MNRQVRLTSLSMSSEFHPRFLHQQFIDLDGSKFASEVFNVTPSIKKNSCLGQPKEGSVLVFKQGRPFPFTGYRSAELLLSFVRAVSMPVLNILIYYGRSNIFVRLDSLFLWTGQCNSSPSDLWQGIEKGIWHGWLSKSYSILATWNSRWDSANRYEVCCALVFSTIHRAFLHSWTIVDTQSQKHCMIVVCKRVESMMEQHFFGTKSLFRFHVLLIILPFHIMWSTFLFPLESPPSIYSRIASCFYTVLHRNWLIVIEISTFCTLSYNYVLNLWCTLPKIWDGTEIRLEVRSLMGKICGRIGIRSVIHKRSYIVYAFGEALISLNQVAFPITLLQRIWSMKQQLLQCILKCHSLLLMTHL